ncbi:hypothetical protein HAX54_031896, partial [Datura stramonium]|nr:hypothetical protein [Datura stramonium]
VASYGRRTKSRRDFNLQDTVFYLCYNLWYMDRLLQNAAEIQVLKASSLVSIADRRFTYESQ